MSKYLKSVLIPSYFMPTMFPNPVLLGDIIEIKDDCVAAKLLAKSDQEGEDEPKPYFVEATKKEFETAQAGKVVPAASTRRRPVAAAAESVNTEAPVDPTTRVSSEGEAVATKDADDAAKAQELAKAAETKKADEPPAKPVAKPAAKAVKRAAPAKPQRKAATK